MMILQRKYLKQEISELSIHELRNFAKLWNINIDGITGKEDIIKAIDNFRRQFYDLHKKSVPILNDLIKICNIPNVKGSGKNGKIIKTDLIKAIYDFIGEDPEGYGCRVSIKITNCPYVYFLQSAYLFYYVEKIDQNKNKEYFRMKLKDTNVHYKEFQYHLESDQWLSKGQIIKDDNYYNYCFFRFRKASTFIETLILYLKVKLVFDKNTIPNDITSHTMLLYCRYFDIIDIKVI
jgi:hypothetical protein